MENIKWFLEYYESVRKRTIRLIKTIPAEQIGFNYKNGKFLLADQIRHIACIERYMFGETIAGRKSKYTGCGEEFAVGYEKIMALFIKMYEETLEILNELTDEDLKRNCFTPTRKEINIGKWLQLLTEHEIHHRAQIYLYLGLLDLQTLPIYGLSSEELVVLSRDKIENN